MSGRVVKRLRRAARRIAGNYNGQVVAVNGSDDDVVELPSPVPLVYCAREVFGFKRVKVPSFRRLGN